MRRFALTSSIVALSAAGACSLVNAPEEIKAGTGGSGAGGDTTSSTHATTSSTGGPQECKTAADCTAPDACHVVNRCDPVTFKCVFDAAPNNTPCDDGKACTVGDICVSGVCTSGQPKPCTPSNDCHTSTCDENAGGQCVEKPVPDGNACDDKDPCTATSACQGGVCVKGPSCQDTECTKGVCTPQGCMDQPKQAGTACGNTACSTGQCNAVGQCVITPINQGGPCDDGLFCTNGDTCNDLGQCVGGPPTCQNAPDQPCVDVGCDEALQTCTATLLPNGTACDDGDGCTIGEVCQNGNCTPNTTITVCGNGDGCCPAGCTLANDGDCAITMWSQGTQQWPDDACNPVNSFGTCNTNAQDHADAWATFVCQQNGYSLGI